MPNLDKKTEANKRFNSLQSEYKKFESAFQTLSTYLNPTRGKFVTQKTKGQMIDHKTLLDDHATNSIKILASGMQSGMTSPSRPWCRLNIADKERNKVPAVRVWLDDTTEKMLDVCANSNTYDVFYSMYEELGQFATSCSIILEDYDSVIRLRNFTAGEYYLGTDSRGIVNSFAREFELKVGQCVEMFGYNNCSPQIQQHKDNNRVDVDIIIRHLIEPNTNADLSMDDNKNMLYRSVYWELSEGGDKFLSTTGFIEFPVIAPRWDTVTSNEVYGYGPGWFAIGNVKQLQKTCLDELISKEKSYDPPMLEDSTVSGVSNYMPGGKTKTTSSNPNTGAKPAYQINPNLESFHNSKVELKEAIDKTFFVNVFLMMVNFDKTNMTATEVAQREQENVMMMGPLLNRVNKEMLTGFLERLYAIMDRNGLFLPPPEEISGQDIKIEFISILSQAQKAIGAISIDRTLNRIQNIAAVKPEVLDVIDFDEAAREYANMEGIPAKLVIDKRVVKMVRDQRVQAQQMMTNLAAADQGANVAKNLASADMEGDNALTRASSMVGSNT